MSLDVGVRLQPNCRPNGCQNPFPANKRSDDSDLARYPKITELLVGRQNSLLNGGDIMLRNALFCAAALLAVFGAAYSQSPYAGQESREIKALSPREVSDLLAGKGMGFAKAAELNGYPGPAHVLELAAQLQLTPEQMTRTEALFKKMEAQAVAIGRQLVEEERALDHQFSSKSITPASLQSSLERIAKLQTKLRRVHLETHLEQTALLSDMQIVAYSKLRGYGRDSDNFGHRRRHH
jgi:hypothetical protein